MFWINQKLFILTGKGIAMMLEIEIEIEKRLKECKLFFFLNI